MALAASSALNTIIQRSLRIVSTSKSIFKQKKKAFEMQLSKIHVFSFKTTRVKYKIHLNQIDNSIEGGHYLKYFTHPFIMSQARASSLIARAESSIRFSHR